MPLPGTQRAAQHPALPAAGLTEVVRLCGLRQWVEQGYKQVKQELGWADFQVRSDRAIRRHWALVCCAFCFCWWTEGQRHGRDRPDAAAAAHAVGAPPSSLPLAQESGAGEKWGSLATGDLAGRARQLLAAARSASVLAPGAAAGAGLA